MFEKMKNSTKKIAAVLSAAILGALPMANSFTANAAKAANDVVKFYYGDVCGENGKKTPDGKITAEDAQKVLIWSSKGVKDATADQKRRADVDGDGNVSGNDAQMVLEFYVSAILCENDILGDAEGDNTVDIGDPVRINRYHNKTIGNLDIDFIRADVNKDGIVNNYDSKLVQKYLAGYTDVFNVRYGDTNSDGEVTEADARKLARFLAEDKTAKFSDIELRRADVNYDGKVNYADLNVLLMRTAKNIGHFCD